MEKFSITLTVNAWIKAQSQEEAQEVFERMEIKCTDLDTKKEIESELVYEEWEEK
jgi:crotonobetainyl-CoA:carnitine CoA-transferase CaiB-like acyl-CoA transferase